MIIECSSCHTRFRLDESKIKGKGARVRCRRCGDSIMVLKPKENPSAAAGEGTLDLRWVVKESLEERPEPVKRAEPPHAVPAASGEPEPLPPPEETILPGKDDIDRAFDRIFDSPWQEESEKTAGLSLDFPPEEAIDFRPPEVKPAEESSKKDFPHDISDSGFLNSVNLEEAVKKESTTGISDASFLLSDAETLDDLAQDFAKGSGAEPRPLDISGNLRPGSDLPPPPQSETFQTSFTPPDLSETEAPPSPPDFMLHEPGGPAPEEEPVSAPPIPPVPPEPTKAKEAAAPRPPERRQASSSRVRPFLAVLILLFLAIAGGGAYLGFTRSGQDLLKSVFPGMESLWLRGGKPGPQFDVRNLIGYYEPNPEAGKLFIIKGQVINVGRGRKSGIRIKASLLDEKDQAVVETSSYAGNVLSGDAVRRSTRNEIEKILSNRFGERLMNMEVQPGKSVPFMVVFFDAPGEISAYRIEALEGD